MLVLIVKICEARNATERELLGPPWASRPTLLGGQRDDVSIGDTVNSINQAAEVVR